MAENPTFTATPNLGMVQISTANTGRDGTGSLGTVLTAGANGTRISRIVITAAVTTTAGMVRLFIGDNAGTPNIRLWKEVVVTAITVAANTLAFTYTLELLDERALILPAGYTLQASTEKAETFNVFADGGDY